MNVGVSSVELSVIHDFLTLLVS